MNSESKRVKNDSSTTLSSAAVASKSLLPEDVRKILQDGMKDGFKDGFLDLGFK